MNSYKILLLAVLFSACKIKTELSPDELQNKLNQTMQEYLYNQINNDSTHIKYHVLSGYNFAEVEYYDCEFKVYVKKDNHDTTGIMSANISKDFTTVKRKS